MNNQTLNAKLADAERSLDDKALRRLYLDAMQSAEREPELLRACINLRNIIHDYMTHAEQRVVADELRAADAILAKHKAGAK